MSEASKLMATREELVAFVNDQLDAVRAQLAGGTTGVMPAVVVESRALPDAPPERTAYALAVDFNEHEVKHKVMRDLGRLTYLSRRFPTMACLVSEAWAAVREGGGPHARPRDCPGRREVVIVVACAFDLRPVGAVLPVRRGEGDRLVEEPGPGGGEVLDMADSALLREFYTGFFEATAPLTLGIDLAGKVLGRPGEGGDHA